MSIDPSRTKRRVAVVDDEAENLDLAVRALRDFDVHCFRETTSALASIPKLDPIVVLTDYRMPGMTGLELVRRLREGGVRSVILLVTAYGDVDDILHAERDKLLFGVIRKPWTPLHLRRQVELAAQLYTIKSRNG